MLRETKSVDLFACNTTDVHWETHFTRTVVRNQFTKQFVCLSKHALKALHRNWVRMKSSFRGTFTNGWTLSASAFDDRPFYKSALMLVAELLLYNSVHYTLRMVAGVRRNDPAASNSLPLDQNNFIIKKMTRFTLVRNVPRPSNIHHLTEQLTVSALHTAD